MIVRNEIKKYIGAIDDENKAALFYDKYAMIIQGYEVSAIIVLPTSFFDHCLGTNKLLLH